jgi:hypothetical protein
MADEKTRAHDLAMAWWASAQGKRSRARGYAICDNCNGKIGPGEGCLASPAVLGIEGMPMTPSPDLICESCFRSDRTAWNPDQSGVFGRPLTPPEKLYPPVVRNVPAGGRKPFWKFW